MLPRRMKMKKFLSTVAVAAIFTFSASVASACGVADYTVGGDVSSSLYGSGAGIYATSYLGGNVYAYTPEGVIYGGSAVYNSIATDTGRRGSADANASGATGFNATRGSLSTWSVASTAATASNGGTALAAAQASNWVQKYGSITPVSSPR